jgi:hypothetical protein
MRKFVQEEFDRLKNTRFYDQFYSERTAKYRDLEDFRKIYNKEFLKNMKLEEYVVGMGSTDSFCYHLERTFGCFGAISTSSAYKFGIFYSRSRKQYEYYPKWGSGVEEAFANVKSSILDLLHCAEVDDVDGIVGNILAPMIKGKILHLYFPEKYFNIYADNHLDFYLQFYGLDTRPLLSGPAFYKQEKLLEFKNSDPVMKDWTIDKFATFLYFVYPKAPNRQDDVPVKTAAAVKSSASFVPKPQLPEVPSELAHKLEALDAGLEVTHKKFGTGEIVKIDKKENLIFIRFSNEEKKFKYPDAFLMGYLRVE